MKRRVFNLADLSGNDNSGEGEMIVQLYKKIYVTRKKYKV
jgi:hypothetical protein